MVAEQMLVGDVGIVEAEIVLDHGVDRLAGDDALEEGDRQDAALGVGVAAVVFDPRQVHGDGAFGNPIQTQGVLLIEIVERFVVGADEGIEHSAVDPESPGDVIGLLFGAQGDELAFVGEGDDGVLHGDSSFIIKEAGTMACFYNVAFQILSLQHNKL